MHVSQTSTSFLALDGLALKVMHNSSFTYCPFRKRASSVQAGTGTLAVMIRFYAGPNRLAKSLTSWGRRLKFGARSSVCGSGVSFWKSCAGAVLVYDGAVLVDNSVVSGR